MTKAEDVARRWILSEKGQTPEREKKAKLAAKRLGVSWNDVLDAAKQLHDAPLKST